MAKRKRKQPRLMKLVSAGGFHDEVADWLCYRTLASIARDASSIVAAARKAIQLYHRGRMSGDRSAVRAGALVAWAADERWWELRQAEHGCQADASDVLAAAVAAPIGVEPLWGQPGRWVVEVLGCRIDLQVEGLFGLGFAECRVIDHGKPFISPTGYQSLTSGCAERKIGETPTQYWARDILRTISTDSNGKPFKGGPRLVNPPFGVKIHRGAETRVEPYEHDEEDPAWKPGGFLYGLAGAPPVPIRQEANAQLALAF